MAGNPTGLWLSELAEPYYAFLEKGYTVTIASTAGGPIPIDAGSMKGDFFTADAKKFMHDPDAVGMLGHSKKLEAAMADEFDAVYLTGGHGCCVDFIGPKAAGLVAIIEKMYAAGKLVVADCHGPMGLIDCKKADGTPLVEGLEVTAFTDAEETAVGALDWVTGNSKSMQQAFTAAGGNFKAGADWGVNVCVAGNLITAQNPGSAVACAQATIKALS